MSRRWPRVIRDPVHNIIVFEDTPCDRLLIDLINTREFQRLRRIRQLGMSELVFPGANHSGFAHSIGVLHVARRMLRRVDELTKVEDEHRMAVLAAALLHDIGHGPFSHAFEKVTKQKHEARTLEIIRSEETEVGKRLREYDADLPGKLAVFFDEDIDETEKKNAAIPDRLTQLVSSQLDADRFDYLLRDSLATGTNYGLFDLEWLILQSIIDGKLGRLILMRKALDAAEAYVFARYHMYRSVYFHKTVRAAEVMARLVLQRFKEMAEQASSESKRLEIVPDARPGIVGAFSGQLGLFQYLELDDATLTEFFKACGSSQDAILSELGRGLTERKLYKAIDVTDLDPARIGKFATAAAKEIEAANLSSEYAFVDETAADTPYKPYNPDASRPASQIYIEASDGSTKEISECSDALVQLRKRYSLVRYYFPERLRDRIQSAARETLQLETNG
jgi:hypothetical protein